MSKPKPPTPPDPVATAQAQSAANRDTVGFNTTANNPNIITPSGTVMYQGGDPAYAGQRPTQIVTESENQRALREAQERAGISLGNLGAEQASRVGDILSRPYQTQRFNSRDATGGPLDLARALGTYDNSRFDPTTALGGQQQIENDTFDLATQGMDRAFGRQEEGLRTRLANQGVNAGTEAFGEELRSFNEGRGDAFANARLQARGVAEATRANRAGELAQGAGLYSDNYNQQLASLLQERGTNLSEAETDYARTTAADLADRQTPLGEISAIINGTPLTQMNPGAYFTSAAAPGDIQGNTYASYNGQVNANNARTAARGAALGGLAGLGGSVLGAAGTPLWLRGLGG